jgi:outer membrane protein assembly factor BamB
MFQLKQILFVLCIGFLVHLNLHANKGDWTQWGGSDNRNMVSDAENLPDDFELGKAVRNESQEYKVDMSTTRHVKWAAKLGSQTYGNPTVSGGKIFVGTNDACVKEPRFQKTQGGRVLCFSEKTGTPLWQLIIPRFRTPDRNFNYDDGNYGVCSSPTVQGDRVYLVTNRGEVLCLDAEGMANGNDGPFKEEAEFMTDGNAPDIQLQSTDGDIIWRYDMIKEVPSRPQDASNCSVLLYKDGVFVCTSNGVDRSHTDVPFPDSPSLIVLDKHTGRLVAKDNEKIGRQLFHGNWSNPSMGIVNGKPLIFWGGGDGVCYAFEPPAVWSDSGEIAILKKIWSCDCNPAEYKSRDGESIPYQKQQRSFSSDEWGRGPSEIISTPVFYNNRVYVTIGQDPRHGRGEGAITCIDATQQGDITTSGKVWTCKLVNRSLSTPSIYNDLVYVLDYSGNLHCLDANTGLRYWVHETGSPTWSSTLAADGKVYFGNERKDFWILKAGREKEVLNEIRLPDSMYNTPIAANGTMYLATQQYLYAISAP